MLVHVIHMLAHVRRAPVHFWARRAAPPNSRTCPSIILLEVSYVLFLMVRRVLEAMEQFIASGPILFCFLSSLENYKLVFFVFNILISVFILFIFNFYSWPFYKTFICFQFHHSIPICHILFFSIWFVLFWFLICFQPFFNLACLTRWCI